MRAPPEAASEVAVLQSRAEFYLCVARAFLAPKDEGAWRGVTDCLADDLETLSRELSYAANEPIGALRASARQFPDPLSLLQVYARLFLTPPVAARINTAIYLDGGVLGGAARAMQACYRRHGLDGAPHFHDLPDHLSMQLEFVAYLWGLAAAHATAGDHHRAAALAEEAGQFLEGFVQPALAPLRAELASAAQATSGATLYLALVRVLEAAVVADCAAAADRAIIEGARDLP